MLYRLPSLIEEMGQDMLQVGDAPVARVKQLTMAGQRTAFMSEHTIVFVLQGQKQLIIEGETHTASAGQLFLVKRGIYMMSELFAGSPMYEALILFFTDAFVKKFLYTYDLGVTSPVTAPAHLVLSTNPLLEDFKQQFLGYFNHLHSNLDTILPLKQQELMLLLLAGPYREKVLPFLRSIASGTPQDIEYIVREHLFQPLSVEELAKLSGRSLASFKRDFQQVFQASPKKWINEQRLRHAYQTLQHSDKNVSEVALACGFENIPHFIRIFKEQYGTTPNAVRAKKAIL